MMTAIKNESLNRHDLWAESRRAEEQGDIFQALEIHKKILRADTSYAASLRAGWLYYKLDEFEESLRYYEQACALTNDDWPWFGIMNCLIALGETDALARVVESLYGTEHTSIALPA
ncbi:hypothetical protein P4B35_15080 [Pontiellaceae bacterium B12227]|nr:hypothetical protein [Pontiellaceae bacterium B12227]